MRFKLNDPITPADLEDIDWLEPWERVSAERAAQVEQHLLRVLPADDALRTRAPKAIAEYENSEDVLYLVTDPFELITLRLSDFERELSGPTYVAYPSINLFIHACMQPDHDEYTDEDV